MANNSRLYKTSLGGWHELVALSQIYINQSFSNMYKLADPDSPLKAFNKKIGGVGKMTNCILKAPELVLMVEDNDFNYLAYHLNFQQGDLMLYEDEDGDVEKHFNVKDWSFVFKIRIGAKEIPRESLEFREISERVPLIVDFSLSKLWLDSTTADTGNKKLQAESYFGGLDWSKEPYPIQDNFDTFIIKWVSAAADKGQTLVGVTVHPKETGDADATFPPTYLTKQTYPWINPNVIPPPPPKTGLDNNMLLYLMMTGGVNPPIPVWLAPNSGLWIDPDNDVSGTFALSNELFWHRWLLPMLKTFNKYLQFYTKKPNVKVQDNGLEASAEFFWLVGEDPASPDDPKYAFQAGVPGSQAFGFSWGPQDIKVEAADQRGSNWPHGLLRLEATQTGTNSTKVVFVPGSKEIVVSGSGRGYSKMDLKGSNTPAWDTYASLTMDLTWSFTLQITSVDGGGVAVSVKPLGPNESYYTITPNPDEHLDWSLFTSNIKGYSTYVKSVLESRYDAIMQYLIGDLTHKLNNENKLFMPGSGSFLFKDGTFNSHGDFLTAIKYNGTDFSRSEMLAKQTSEPVSKGRLEMPPPLKPLKMGVEVTEGEPQSIQLAYDD